jgi:hypothetical protein
MSDPITPFLGLTKPIVNDEAGEDLWGEKLNTNFDKLDASAADIVGDLTVLQGAAIPEAPVDGKPYGRKDAAWFDVSTLPVSWDSVTGKPATFPPELPIPQVGVTGLVAGQAAQDSQINANTTAIATKEPAIVLGTTAQFWRGDKTWQPLSSITVDAYTKAEADARFEPVITAGTTAQYWKGNKTWATLDKAAVGLGNVDNTSDANKPISTATASALAGKENTIAAGNPTYFWRGDKTWQPIPPAGITDAPSDGVTYGRKNAAWTAVSGPVTVALVAPTSPRNGDLWFKSDVCLLYVFYDDGNTQQWVQTIPNQSIDGLDARYVAKAGDTMTGNLTLPNLTATGTGTFGGNLTANQNFLSSTAVWLGAPTGSGTVYLRPSGIANTTGQLSMTASVANFNGPVAGISTFTSAGGFICQPASAYSSFMAMNGAGNAYLTMGLDGSGGGIINHSAPSPYISFALSGSQYMKISATGVIIQPPAQITNYTLDVRGSANIGAIIGFCNATTYYGINGYMSGANAYSFYGNGPAFLVTGTWGTSDARFKEISDDNPFGPGGPYDKPACDIVEAIPVRAYKFLGPMADASINGVDQFGFIAQEVEPVLPLAVTEVIPPRHDMAMRAWLAGVAEPEADSLAAAALEARTDLSFKGLNKDYLIATLWGAVQELTARVKALEGA